LKPVFTASSAGKGHAGIKKPVELGECWESSRRYKVTSEPDEVISEQGKHKEVQRFCTCGAVLTKTDVAQVIAAAEEEQGSVNIMLSELFILGYDQVNMVSPVRQRPLNRYLS
jgi:hypothetical protein